MPPTLKPKVGHITFGLCVCVRACMRAYVTLFMPTVTFELVS